MFRPSRARQQPARLALVVATALAASACGDPGIELPPPVATGLTGTVFSGAETPDEPSAEAVADATVNVFNRFGAPVGQPVTDADGTWLLDELPAATEPYSIAVTITRDGATWSQRSVADIGESVGVRLPEPSPCDPCAPLLLPDLVPLATVPEPMASDGFPGPDRASIDRESEPGRTLLRVGTATANIGDGPVLVIGLDPTSDDRQAVAQRIFDEAGDYQDVAQGEFVFHPGHDHIHLDRFETLELVADDGTVLASSKQSFCLTDVLVTGDERPPITQGQVIVELAPWECGARAQGINVGWADYYGPELDDQFIDVTGLAPGVYRLRITVDPDDVIDEVDETNNVIELDVRIDG